MLDQRTTPPVFGDTRLPARFWAKVNPNGPIPANRPELGPCWEWTAYRLHNGYGVFSIGSRTDGTRRVILAHRIAYERLVGLIPEGVQSDHLCRNRPCIRPTHIEPVTQRENGRRGVRPSKLVAANIPVIRSLCGRLTLKNIARWYGVSEAAICRAQSGKNWAHIKEGAPE